MKPRLATIFGGSGFLGRHVVRHLAPHGVTMRIAVRDPERAKFLKLMGTVGQIVPIRANIRDEASVARAVEGADAVINLVGILFEKGRQRFQAIHAEGPRRIARAAKAAEVGRLVHVSALGADSRSRSVYARTKAAGEAAVREAFPEATIVRPSIVFGPEDDFFNRFGAMARLAPALPVFFSGFPRIDLFKDFPFPSVEFKAGTNRMQPVYVADVASAITKILLDPETRGRTYEFGGPTVYTFADLLRLVLRETGYRRFLLPVPFFAAEILAIFLELLPVPPLTRDQLKQLKRDNVVSPGALALSDLGIAPTAPEAVLPTYLGRFRSRPPEEAEVHHQR